MPQFELRQSSQFLTSRAGLVLVGHALERFAGLTRAIDPRFPVRTGIPTSDLLKSYVGLLCESKSDFDAIQSKPRDRAFALALKLRQVPSSPTLRQRLDDLGVAGATAVDALTVPLLQRGRAPITALDTGHVALDIDVFTLDNSGTRKEGVARTYQGYDGDAPIAAYLGQEGWCVGLELRAGDRHSAHETQYTLVLSLAALAYNVLRLIGQHTLLGEDAPLRHPAKRRRLKTVIQELIAVAARVLTHARRTILDFGVHCPSFIVFDRTWTAWHAAPS